MRINALFDNKGIFEWPTWMLIIAVYTCWAACLQYYHTIGPLPAGALLVVIGALHGSVQHELLHGHPTRVAWFNSLLAYLPITLLFPYPVYRQTHMAHHTTDNLTAPGIDPESYYVSQATWKNSNALQRHYHTIRMTLLGRLLLGPAHSAVSLFGKLLRDITAGSMTAIGVWALHLLLITGLLYGLHVYFQIPLWHYLIIAYLANALSMLRSFFEHRAAACTMQRTVIVECGWFFRLLFLNNNYHVTHHEHPTAPWYRLGALYRENRDSTLQKNNHYYYSGYHHWLLAHLLKPIDSPIHPFANE